MKGRGGEREREMTCQRTRGRDAVTGKQRVCAFSGYTLLWSFATLHGEMARI